MNVAIIGAGLIGRKRALALPKNVKLAIVCNRNKIKGEQFAKDFNCKYEPDWKKVVINPEIQVIMICTTNNWLAPIAIASIQVGKHVLIEKPGAISLIEFKTVIEAHKENPVVVMFGYDYRY